VEAVGRLGQLDGDVLAVLSLFPAMVDPTSLAHLARSRGVASAAKRALTTSDARASADRLVELALVELRAPTRNHPHYGVRSAVAMAALEVAQERGRLSGLAEARSRKDQLLYWGRADLVGDIRVAIVAGDAGAVEQAIRHRYAGDEELARVLLAAIGDEPRPSWLELLPRDQLRAHYLALAVRGRWLTLRPLADHVIGAALAAGDKRARLEVGRALAVRGDGERAAALDGLPRWGREGLELLVAFWAGDFARAHAIGERAAAGMKGRKRAVLPDLEGLCHVLASIAVSSSQPEAVDSVGRQVQAIVAGLNATWEEAGVLADVHAALVGETRSAFTPLCGDYRTDEDWVGALLLVLHDVWLRPAQPAAKRIAAAAAREAAAVARSWHGRAAAGGYGPVARELAAVMAALAGQPGSSGLAGAFDPPAPWKTGLASLEAMARPAEEVAGATSPAGREVVWEVEARGDELAIRPRVRSGGRARKGQPVSISRLVEDEDGIVTDADRRVLATASVDPWGRGYPMPSPGFGPRAAVALIGHPRVIDGDGAPLVIERGRATVRACTVRGMTRVELSPAALGEMAFAFEEAAPGRLVVFERNGELARLADILARGGGLEVPAEGRERLASALARLCAAASIDIEGDLVVGARDVPADARPVFQLAWNGAALGVRLRVAPLGVGGPMLRPGVGAASFLGEVRADRGGAGDGGLCRCERDLAEERRRCEAALDASPVLSSFAAGELEWSAPSLPEALDVMVELGALGEGAVVAWQEGQLAVPRAVDLRDLRLAVGGGRGWLDIDAALTVDEDTVLGFRELVRGRQGRFVALSQGRFLALSDRLRRHLDSLASLGSLEEESIRAPWAVLPLVEELASTTGELRLDEAAMARLEKLRAIAGLVPRVPRGFGAALRDYQREGFEWMARLAEADLGACLADDMGLGKTLQALALLAHRAALGPALVVCPSSVVHHWMGEAARFAPALRLRPLSDAATGDRAALVGAAGPRDVLVASYGLLPGEADALAGGRFATVVFDEAHALKNPRTRRAAAARRIQADFRLALTGTPVENHLGELWSLFGAILPGLLGTRAEFDERFAVPLASGDRERAARLRALLRPFILRRLKAQVLDELPPRTEVTLCIAPYPEQLAFYEAVRRQAVERTEAMDPQKARFQVLAEITRLRQAAIDPRVLEPAGPKGAKIDALIERVQELRAEGHRALVFTQFLGSMAAVRERLTAEGIEFHELDGSTPAAERARRIQAFQAGEGDVFLLSLRAGGVGVNLTGADYVFHLDPWWNPAVEDQASDRAHRIGQERPVTIYRLVTQGTIEEKILALHASKRQLADDLLAGLDRSEALDVDRLLELLQD